MTEQRSEQAADKTAIRPFHVNVPEAELTELRRRIHATRWPERELVNDISQGVQLATIQKLARYWATDYDWRKIEAKLNLSLRRIGTFGHGNPVLAAFTL